jgi:formylmethanofuran dehydrogenase subunit C
MAHEMEGQYVYGEAGEIIGGSLDGSEEGLGAGAHIIIEGSKQVGLGWPMRKAWA